MRGPDTSWWACSTRLGEQRETSSTSPFTRRSLGMRALGDDRLDWSIWFGESDHDRVRIAGWCLEGSRTDGPVVMLLHGAGGADSTRLLPLAQSFSEVTGQVVSF